jgi:N-acetyl-gamma-glutamyl-phosphate reductase
VGHPALTVAAVSGGTRQGEDVASVQPHLLGALDQELVSVEEAASGAEVVFSCLPHGVLPDLVEGIDCDLLVDLAEDHRSHPDWVYGLPELDRTHLAGAPRISNPGCYPTASLLCLVPFARAGLIGESVIIDALSGVSGAGRTARDGLLFSTIEGGATAYGSVEHRHVAEIERGLLGLGGVATTVSFTPHLAPMTRGLLVTARFPIQKDASDKDVLLILNEAYETEPFVHVTEEWPATKAVAGTNRAHVSARVDHRAGYVVCSAAIDNLGKGAAGQALQNANLALGLGETTGLEGLAVWP